MDTNKVLKVLIKDYQLPVMRATLTDAKTNTMRVEDVKTFLCAVNMGEVTYNGVEIVRSMNAVEPIYKTLVTLGLITESINPNFCHLSDKAMNLINEEGNNTYEISLLNGEVVRVIEKEGKTIHVEYRNTAVEIY